MIKNDFMEQELMERVLEGLGFNSVPDVSYESLTSIYQKWCQKIPFDNIMKRIQMNSEDLRVLPGDNPKDFFENWLKTGVGGTCWAGNGSFCALLSTLGFPARRGISTMISSSNKTAQNLPPHGNVIVNFGNAPMIVDTTMMHNEPIILNDHDLVHPIWGTSTKWNGENWEIKWNPLGRPKSNCRIDELSVTSRDFSRHHENSKSLSRFNHSTIFRIIKNERLEGIVLGNRVVRLLDGQDVSIPIDSEMIKKILIEDYNILEELVYKIPSDAKSSKL